MRNLYTKFLVHHSSNPIDRSIMKNISVCVVFDFSKQEEKSLGITKIPRLSLVAGVGFEPHDLRVMSPTSYQAALPRDI